MKVIKFGGTSVGSGEIIKKVIDIVKKELKTDPSIWVVVSAFSGVTEKLIQIAKLAEKNDPEFHTLLNELISRHIDTIKYLFSPQTCDSIIEKAYKDLKDLKSLINGVSLLRELSKRSLDLVMSFGERLSAFIISEYAREAGEDSKFLDTRDLIVSDDNFGFARVKLAITSDNLKNYYDNNKGLHIVTGFIASTESGVTTTLGRGGSDFTASLIGSILEADEIQIWSDVDGVMTANPKKVHKAFSIHEITYEEAMELSHFGAKVLYPLSIKPAEEKNIPLKLFNTFNLDFKGTTVKSEVHSYKYLISGISSIEDIALLRIQGSGMVGVSGISKRLFGTLAEKKINIIMITQGSSEHSICIAITPDSVSAAKKAIENEFQLEIKAHMIDDVIIERDCSIIAVVGENMMRMPGVAGKLFSSLGRNGVNVVAIAQGSSELNISIVVSKKDEVKALNAIHEVFFLAEHKTVNIFMIGTGLVGNTLLKQIRTFYQKADSKIRLNVIALANSRKMIFNPDGIDLEDWKTSLEKSDSKMSVTEYILQINELNLAHSIFVDCTASKEIADCYSSMFKSSVSIVTPNKIANAGEYKNYSLIRQYAAKHNVQFFYETNVAAGLPVISTLKDLRNSGDKIIKIEGVFSGTLSYIFNSFVEGKKFSDIVKEAKEKGYTEPDPRLDLNGIDIARKLLILIRELGVKMEIDDVIIEKILPPRCFEANSVDAFLQTVQDNDDYFEQLRLKAAEKGKVLRYIGLYENNKASVVLREVDPSHPFYFLEGSDNIVSFTTKRYRTTPMVIKGAGAGADVTAAGVLADIIRVSKLILSQ